MAETIENKLITLMGLDNYNYWKNQFVAYNILDVFVFIKYNRQLDSENIMDDILDNITVDDINNLKSKTGYTFWEILFSESASDAYVNIQKIFDKSMSLNIIDSYGKSSLHYACFGLYFNKYINENMKMHSNERNFKCSFTDENNKCVLNSMDDINNQGIYYNIIKYILEKNGNVNLQDNDGNIPLMYSLNYSNNYSAILALMKNYGVDLNIENNDKHKPINYIMRHEDIFDKVDNFELNLNNRKEYDNFILSIRDNPEILNRYISKDIGIINHINEFLLNPVLEILLYYFTDNDKECIRILVLNGVKINIIFRGMTLIDSVLDMLPLDPIGHLRKFNAKLEYLVGKNIDINIKNENNLSWLNKMLNWIIIDDAIYRSEWYGLMDKIIFQYGYDKDDALILVSSSILRRGLFDCNSDIIEKLLRSGVNPNIFKLSDNQDSKWVMSIDISNVNIIKTNIILESNKTILYRLIEKFRILGNEFDSQIIIDMSVYYPELLELLN